MPKMMYAMLAIGLSIVALVLTAAMKVSDIRMAYVHMAIAAVTAVVLALLGIRETHDVVTRGGTKNAVAASKARWMGLVWAWCSLCMLATYGTGVLSWKEWWHFTVPFFLVAALCLYCAAKLGRDETEGRADDKMLGVLSVLAKVQLAGTLVAMVGLVLDGKMRRFLTEAGNRLGWQDWAANNYFFFGALALAALSLHAISKGAQAKA